MYLRILMFVFLALFALTGAGCDCGDDDDNDDNDVSGDDDDDDTGDDDDDDDDDDVDAPPVIENTTELKDTEDVTGPYSVETDVSDDVGVAAVSLFYQVDGGGYTEVTMTEAKAGATFSADIPGQTAGTFIEYYVQATDAAQQSSTDPATAPTDAYAFYILQESYIAYDDGTSELSMATSGLSSGFFLRVTPDFYPAYLTSIFYFCRDVLGVGEVQPYVIYAEAKDAVPPDINMGFPVGASFTPTTFDTYVEIDVSGTPELATPLEAGDFYIGFRNTVFNLASDAVFFGWDTDTMIYTDRSWGWYLDFGDWFDEAAYGIVMFRATVLTP